MLGEVIKVESIIWCGLSYTRQDKTYEITNSIFKHRKSWQTYWLTTTTNWNIL